MAGLIMPHSAVAGRRRVARDARPRPDAAGRRRYIFGKITVSITWMTPFDAMTSALTTLALSTLTPFDASIFTLPP